jgi:hypothetical protein
MNDDQTVAGATGVTCVTCGEMDGHRPTCRWFGWRDDVPPRTDAEFWALPEGGGFGSEVREIDGRRVRVPIAPDLVAFWVDDTGGRDGKPVVRSLVDANGDAWRLERYANGRWCRRFVG